MYSTAKGIDTIDYSQEYFKDVTLLLYNFLVEVELRRNPQKQELLSIHEGIDKTLQEIENKPNHHCLLALKDDAVIGFNMANIHLNSSGSYRDKGVAEFSRLYVKNTQRGLGIGYGLDLHMIEKLKLLKQEGEEISKVVTEIEQRDVANIQLKSKLKFRRIESSVNRLPNGRTYFLYWKKI